MQQANVVGSMELAKPVKPANIMQLAELLTNSKANTITKEDAASRAIRTTGAVGSSEAIRISNARTCSGATKFCGANKTKRICFHSFKNILLILKKKKKVVLFEKC